MDNVGISYANGEYVHQDWKKAVAWYEPRSSRAGFEGSMVNLGGCYAEGNGVIQNYDKAVEWYEKAAAMGRPDAMTGLGLCYQEGTGVHKNLCSQGDRVL